MDELASKLENYLLHGMVEFSPNTVSGEGWYVDNGASRYMTFNRLLEQVDSIKGELGNDATHIVS